MNRPLNFSLFLLACVITVTTYAQSEPVPVMNLGDPAPPLHLRTWIKGKPVNTFEKGEIYVLEFWATWCKPCVAAMPHLSALAREYRDRVTVLGIDVMESKTTSIQKIKAFVDSMGSNMDYNVAVEDSNFMVAAWFEPLGEAGIPHSFVVNGEGRLAWIGHPKDLAGVLPKIANNTWDIQKALAERNTNRHLHYLDREAIFELVQYSGDPLKPDDLGKPDSALLMIDEIVKANPKLKYAPFIASWTFSSLLKTDPQKAYEFGKKAIVTYTYEEPAYHSIIGTIESYSNILNLSPEIYGLGAEACQAEIDGMVYPQLANMSRRYSKMAEWYWRAGNKAKAIAAQQEAIETLKSRKNYSRTDLAALEDSLQQYRNQ